MARWCAGENPEAAVPSLETAAPFGSFRRLRPAFCQRQGGDVLRGCRVYRKLDKHSVKKRQGVCRFFYVIFSAFVSFSGDGMRRRNDIRQERTGENNKNTCKIINWQYNKN